MLDREVGFALNKRRAFNEAKALLAGLCAPLSTLTCPCKNSSHVEFRSPAL